MKTVLVLMHDDSGQESRMEAALDLARAVGGTLLCVDVVIVPTLAGTHADPAVVALLLEDEDNRERANRERMEKRLEQSGIAYEWVEDSGYLHQCVRAAAERADVIVLNRGLDRNSDHDMRALVGDTVVGTGKPIVAVPESARGFRVHGHALVAWDGSRTSRVALRAAVSLLAHAQSVTILEIEDGSIRMPAELAVEELSQHGVRASIQREAAAGRGAGAVILDILRSTGADWLVMGGFGHSRFMEATFGGVTRRMLQDCPVPMFLAH